MKEIGDPEVLRILEDSEEEARLSALLGIDLAGAPAVYQPPTVYLPLGEWLRRSEEIHRFLRAARRSERAPPSP